MYSILYAHSYEKRVKKILKSHPEIKKQYYKTLKILESNPKHPSLRLHKISGKLKNNYSVSINISYRIVVNFIITGKKIILINVGSHDKLYK